MRIAKKLGLLLAITLLLTITVANIWGYITLGVLTPKANTAYDETANRVVMVFGATGSVGDGLLKAAIEDDHVERIIVVTRRTSPRIDAGVAQGKVELHLHRDYTAYAPFADILPQVNTVLWGLGTSSLNVGDELYTQIHVDFPVAFVNAWLAARQSGPMSFHYVTGMGTDPNGEQHWAREKGRAEHELAELANGTPLRTFSYRSAFIKPTSEQSNALHDLLELVLKPGFLVISAKELGGAMLEISARTQELPNGSLIDNADSVAFAQAYQAR